MTTFRRRIELQAGPALVMLARLPKIVPFLAVLALLIGGLFAPPVLGAVLLLTVAGLLGLLVFLAWHRVPAQGRVLRIGVVALLVIRAVAPLL